LRLSSLILSALLLSGIYAEAQDHAATIQVEKLTDTTSSWDGKPYNAYPSGQPEVSILKITIPPHTTMKWHTHPMPNAAYVIAGELTIEKLDGTKKHVTAGQAVTETVNSIHRGITGDSPVVLVVFYAGATGLPLSQEAHPEPGH
jgi:quercetin dioxygenase-like cupin family protein